MRYTLPAILALTAAVAACAPSASGPVPTDRLYTDIDRDGTTITGRYDPATFTSAQVRNMVSSVVCTQPGLPGYAEAAVDGQVRFSVTCSNGNKYGPSAGINFFKTSPTSVNYAATFSANGAIQQTQGTLDI